MTPIQSSERSFDRGLHGVFRPQKHPSLAGCLHKRGVGRLHPGFGTPRALDDEAPTEMILGCYAGPHGATFGMCLHISAYIHIYCLEIANTCVYVCIYVCMYIYTYDKISGHESSRRPSVPTIPQPLYMVRVTRLAFPGPPPMVWSEVGGGGPQALTA